MANSPIRSSNHLEIARHQARSILQLCQHQGVASGRAIAVPTQQMAHRDIDELGQQPEGRVRRIDGQMPGRQQIDPRHQPAAEAHV